MGKTKVCSMIEAEIYHEVFLETEYRLLLTVKHVWKTRDLGKTFY